MTLPRTMSDIVYGEPGARTHWEPHPWDNGTADLKYPMRRKPRRRMKHRLPGPNRSQWRYMLSLGMAAHKRGFLLPWETNHAS